MHIMKSPLIPFLILAALTCSCSQQKKAVDKSVTDPANKEIYDAAYIYADAMSNYDIDRAEPYATKEAQQTTFVMARNLVKKVPQEYIEKDTPAKSTSPTSTLPATPQLW